VLCKQTAVSAPVALLATLAISGSFVEAVRLGALMGGLGGMAIGLLTWGTDGEFLRHTAFYNINPFDWAQLRRYSIRNLSDTGLIVALSLIVPIQIAAGWAGTSIRSLPPVRRAQLCLVGYWILTGLVCLSAGKIGAGVNYYLEWNVASAVLAASAVGGAVPWVASGRVTRAGLIALVVLGMFGINQLPRTVTNLRIAWNREGVLSARTDAAARALDAIRSAPGPVMSEDMTRAGSTPEWRPASE
jgi:hypothetical protein